MGRFQSSRRYPKIKNKKVIRNINHHIYSLDLCNKLYIKDYNYIYK